MNKTHQKTNVAEPLNTNNSDKPDGDKAPSIQLVNVQTVRFLPRGVVRTAAEKFRAALELAIHDNSASSWKSLLYWPRRLRVPLKSNKRGGERLSNVLRRQLEEDEEAPEPKVVHNTNRNSQKPIDLRVSVRRKIEGGDIRGASRLVLGSDLMAAKGPETLQKL